MPTGVRYTLVGVVVADGVTLIAAVHHALLSMLLPVVVLPHRQIGRAAGQFAKPRSEDFETIDGVSLPRSVSQAFSCIDGHSDSPRGNGGCRGSVRALLCFMVRTIRCNSAVDERSRRCAFINVLHPPASSPMPPPSPSPATVLHRFPRSWVWCVRVCSSFCAVTCRALLCSAVLCCAACWSQTPLGAAMHSYRGDIVNGLAFTEASRRNDPYRMLSAYHQSAQVSAIAAVSAGTSLLFPCLACLLPPLLLCLSPCSAPLLAYSLVAS